MNTLMTTFLLGLLEKYASENLKKFIDCVKRSRLIAKERNIEDPDKSENCILMLLGLNIHENGVIRANPQKLAVFCAQTEELCLFKKWRRDQFLSLLRK